MTPPRILGRYILLPFLASCGFTEAPPSAVTVLDSSGVQITQAFSSGEKVFRVLTPEPLVIIGEADGPAEYTIGRVGGGLLLTEGRIAVGDGYASKVHVFDGSARHQFSIGGPGSGPGEFSVLWTLNRYRGDSIIVGESGAHRLTVFDSEGKLGRVIQPDLPIPRAQTVITLRSCCYFVGALANGDLLLTFPEQIPISGQDPRWAKLPLWVTNPDGESARVLGTFRGGEYRRAGGLSRRPSIGLQVNTQAIVVPHGSGFVQLDGVDHSVRFYSSDGVLRSIGRVAKPREELTPGIREAFEDHFEGLLTSSGLSAEETGLSELINRPYPDSLPAYNFARVDSDGRVWAGRTWSKPIDLPAGFDVFSPEGSYLGEVSLPGAMRVLDVDGSLLLALVKDEYDVPYIHVYGLVPP